MTPRMHFEHDSREPGTPRGICRAHSFLAALAGFALAAAAFGQGTLSTDDGLVVGLSAAGAVTSLVAAGNEYASSTMPSGFAWRELSASPPNTAPNGSFEAGTGSTPTGWSWKNDSYGTWTWDGSVASSGTRSMRVDVPAAPDAGSPQLQTQRFPILPDAVYTMSCRIKTLNVSYAVTMFIVEYAANGQSVQRGIASDIGTNDWETESLTFTTGPTATEAFLKIEIFDGSGTAWVDDVQLSDIFGGIAPVPAGGTVTASDGSVTQSATANGLALDATFTQFDGAIRVDATLSDTTGQDRAVELSFRLPLDIAGWIWDQDPATSTPIDGGTRYEYLARFAGQGHSIFPFANVRNDSAAFSLATPMTPQMSRLVYDRLEGFRVVWDLGLSPASQAPSQATVSFWIYSPLPRWGFRSAADSYYRVNPDPFTTSVTQLGSWAIPTGGGITLSSVAGFEDFGWAFLEGTADVDLANANGMLCLPYVESSGWFRPFPGYQSQPSYDVLVSALQNDAQSATGTTTYGAPVGETAQGVINSSPYGPDGRYQVFANSYFWYGNRIQVYPALPYAGIPAPSMWSVLTKYAVDGRLETARDNDQRLDGIFLDDATSIFASVENHRRELWGYSDFPLTFSYSTRRVMLFDAFSMANFYRDFRAYLRRDGLVLMGSVDPSMYVWFSPYFDVLGGEAPGAESLGSAYVRRVLGNGRPWSNLFVPGNGVAPGASDVLAYLRQGLLLGYFPGFNGTYWRTPAAYERDRALFRQFIPLIRTVAGAGWRPVHGATVSDPSLLVERFDPERGNVFYVTAQNSGGAAKTFQVTLDAATIGIQSGTVEILELVRNKKLAASRVGPDVRFSDTLAPGETFVYQVTAPRPAPPSRAPVRGVRPRG